MLKPFFVWKISNFGSKSEIGCIGEQLCARLKGLRVTLGDFSSPFYAEISYPFRTFSRTSSSSPMVSATPIRGNHSSYFLLLTSNWMVFLLINSLTHLTVWKLAYLFNPMLSMLWRAWLNSPFLLGDSPFHSASLSSVILSLHSFWKF